MSESKSKPKVSVEELKATTAKMLADYVVLANSYGADLRTMQMQLFVMSTVMHDAAKGLTQEAVDTLVAEHGQIILQ